MSSLHKIIKIILLLILQFQLVINKPLPKNLYTLRNQLSNLKPGLTGFSTHGFHPASHHKNLGQVYLKQTSPTFVDVKKFNLGPRPGLVSTNYQVNSVPHRQYHHVPNRLVNNLVSVPLAQNYRPQIVSQPMSISNMPVQIASAPVQVSSTPVQISSVQNVPFIGGRPVTQAYGRPTGLTNNYGVNLQTRPRPIPNNFGLTNRPVTVNNNLQANQFPIVSTNYQAVPSSGMHGLSLAQASASANAGSSITQTQNTVIPEVVQENTNLKIRGEFTSEEDANVKLNQVVRDTLQGTLNS